MSKRKMPMRKIKEILRMKWSCNISERRIATSCGVSRSTVSDSIGRAQAAGLSWPLPDDMDDARLDALLYPLPAPSSKQRPMPDWSYVHQEMKRKGVTLFLLWQEYKAQSPNGFQYSRFSELYRIWRGKLNVSILLPNITAHFINTELRHFHFDDYDKAMAWACSTISGRAHPESTRNIPGHAR